MSCDILFLRTSFTCYVFIINVNELYVKSNFLVSTTILSSIVQSKKSSLSPEKEILPQILRNIEYKKRFVWIFVETLIFCCDFMAVSVSRRLCPEQSGRRILQHFIAGPGGAKFNYRLLHNCVYLQQLLLILFCICTWVTFNSLIFFFLEPFKVKYSNFKIQN